VEFNFKTCYIRPTLHFDKRSLAFARRELACPELVEGVERLFENLEESC
jgi:hypothetical protein